MYDIYANLRDQRGLTDYQVSKDTGLGRSTFTDMKKNKHSPSIATIKKLADYFGVSVEYMMSGKDTEKVSESGSSYYFSDKTAAVAQELFENRDLLLLFDAARDQKPENLRLAAEMLQRFKETNNE